MLSHLAKRLKQYTEDRKPPAISTIDSHPEAVQQLFGLKTTPENGIAASGRGKAFYSVIAHHVTQEEQDLLVIIVFHRAKVFNPRIDLSQWEFDRIPKGVDTSCLSIRFIRDQQVQIQVVKNGELVQVAVSDNPWWL